MKITLLALLAAAAALPAGSALGAPIPTVSNGIQASMAEIRAQSWGPPTQLGYQFSTADSMARERVAREWVRKASPAWKARATKVMNLVNAGQCRSAVNVALSEGDQDMAKRAVYFCHRAGNWGS